MKICYLLTVIANCVLVYAAGNLIALPNPWVEFCVKALLCAFLPNMVVIVLFHNSDEFKALYTYARELLKKLMHKKIER